MALRPGTRLGPYEIVAPLGAGGMGEVYRARDTRLGRDVAVKVLPDRFAADPVALARFEREARAVAALNHPGILSLFDVGSQQGTSYAVMELLEGETLRERLASGPIPARKATDHAVGIALALAAAHDKRIVHRDLKPANVFVTHDGRVKLLDFGLAAHQPAPGSGAGGSLSPTISRYTDPGTVLGTVGYMAPEQVRGQAADLRSDVFSLGCVLFEMLTGRRAFERGTAAETMTAILNADPLEAGPEQAPVPGALESILRHCLEKNPAERFQSARDLAFDLEQARGSSSARSAAVPVPGRRNTARIVALALAGALFFGSGIVVGRRSVQKAPPTFRQLTFQRARVGSARFAPDGQTVVYALAQADQPLRLESTRLDSIEARSLDLPPADVIGVSRSGEMAILINRRHFGTWVSRGTLARVGLAGGAPREILEEVYDGDIAPDGASFAVVRQSGASQVLEFPIGKRLFETQGWISDVRIAPDGRRVAFFEHPLFGDSVGYLALADAAGRVERQSALLEAARGLAWAPDGNAIWCSARVSLGAQTRTSVYTARPGGPLRFLYAAPNDLRLQDVSASGDVLLVNDQRRAEIGGQLGGDAAVRDLTTWMDEIVIGLSDDGDVLAGFEQSAPGAGHEYIAYYRRADGGPVRIGTGSAMGISPDGKYVPIVSSLGKPTQIALVPTGPGEPRILDLGTIVPRIGNATYSPTTWTGDGRRFVLAGNDGDRPPRTFLVDLAGGPPRAVTREGTLRGIVSQDGERVAALDADGRVWLYQGDGEPEPVKGALPHDLPLQWEASGRAFFVWDRSLPIRVFRLEPATGRRELFKEIALADPAGVMYGNVILTPDGQHYAYRIRRMLGELFLARGLS